MKGQNRNGYRRRPNGKDTGKDITERILEKTEWKGNMRGMLSRTCGNIRGGRKFTKNTLKIKKSLVALVNWF